MENKYIQTSLVLNANNYIGKDGKEKYNYIVAAKVWNGKQYESKLVEIRSTNRHNVGEAIFIQPNKSELGNIYFTEIKK